MIRLPSSFFRTAGVAVMLAAVLPASTQAQETAADAAVANEPAKPKERLPLWELGLVGIAADQPAYPGSDQNIARVRVLPFGLYRGSLLRVEGSGIGLRAVHTPRFEWDVSGAGAFGSASNKVHAREGMRGIGTLVEIGPALKINLGDLADARRDPHLTQLELPVRAVFDVNHGLGHRG